MGKPAWLGATTHKDWLFDGGPMTTDIFVNLDWSKARLDTGPSPGGNLGPYWHVPLLNETTHRLYPKAGKWLGVMREACRAVRYQERLGCVEKIKDLTETVFHG